MTPWGWILWALTVWALIGTALVTLGLAAGHAIREVRRAACGPLRSRDERLWERQLTGKRVSR